MAFSSLSSLHKHLTNTGKYCFEILKTASTGVLGTVININYLEKSVVSWWFLELVLVF